MGVELFVVYNCIEQKESWFAGKFNSERQYIMGHVLSTGDPGLLRLKINQHPVLGVSMYC